jgi:hypothetical protein
MDDNHYLVEWLAYHYHFLPLRRLIVAIDPKSKTSPRSLLERYSSRGLMNITIWNKDNDFMPVEEQDKYTTLNQSASFYKARQNWFYLHCMKTIQREYAVKLPPTSNNNNNTTTSTTLMNDADPTTTSKSQPPPQQQLPPPPQQHQPPIWVAMIDTDELVTLNRQAQPDHLLPDIQPTVAAMLNSPNNTKYLADPHDASPCQPMFRLQMGIMESPLTDGPDNIQQWLPTTTRPTTTTTTSSWNGRNFKSLRYRYSQNPSKLVVLSKSLLDVRQIPPNDFDPRNTNAHRPLKTVCSKQNMFLPFSKSPFVIHHYAGTLEQFVFRTNDARDWTRVESAYQQKYNFTSRKKRVRRKTHGNDHARFWLKEFVHVMGEEMARDLLQGAGEVNPQ